MTIEDRAPPWLRALHAGDTPEIDDASRFNLEGMLQGWAQWPAAMDFLSPASPNHAWKALMTRLYRSRIDRFLPPRPARVLDLACGSARLLAPLHREGLDVVGIDATRPSLEAAARHCAGARLIWGDVAELAELVDGPFDAALALELLCYLPSPGRVLTQLAGLLAPGAPLILSVEAWPGGFLADPTGLDPAGIERAFDQHELVEPGVRHVRCYTRSALSELLVRHGFAPHQIEGTHYILDGPLGHLADPASLDGGPYDDRLLALEEQARTDPSLRELPRAWLAVARVA